MRVVLLATALLASLLAGCAQPGPDLTDQACDDGEFAEGIADDGDLDCREVSWDDLDDIPAGFADGVDDRGAPGGGSDTLADLSCTAGQVASYDGTGWECADMPGAVHELTLLTYTGTYIDTVGTNDWRKLLDVDFFTKQSAASEILLHWTGHAQTDDGGGIAKCVYQARIDDRTSRDTAPASSLHGAGAIIGETSGAVPFHTTDVFDWPGSGEHEVSIWVKGSTNECFLNPGNFPHTIIVEEIG